MPDWIPINWQLVGNPINWIIVILMLVIASIGVSVLFGAGSTNTQEG